MKESTVQQPTARLTRDEEIVAFFVRKCASKEPLGRTHLMKLVYLADHEARRYLGRPLSDMQYFWHFFGPWDEKFVNTIKTLDDKRVIREEKVVYPTGKEGYKYKKGIAAEASVSLEPIELAILNHVCTTFADMKLAALLADVVYETDPMKVAREANAKGEPLEMDMVNGERQNEYGISFEELFRRILEVRAGRGISHAAAMAKIRTVLDSANRAAA